ncbi:MAG TPA: YetF domain-containing protein [Cyclobacteriaceae bacterium]|nr:YetF domain-containing protein [Cyclobacteriaceae bacterium]
MNDLLGLDAHDLAWHQMAIRAVIIFFLSMAFIRVAGMRSFGSRSAFDVVLNITIGAILGRCITGHYPFFPCLAAAGVLALCHRLTAFLAFRFQSMRVLMEGSPKALFENGKFDKHLLKKYSINENDVNRALHEENVDELKAVKKIWYETDGKISIVKVDQP